MNLEKVKMVTAANTVDEKGAHATSPTALFKSNVNIAWLLEEKGIILWSHILTVQSAEHDIKISGWNGFHLTASTAICLKIQNYLT
uniref:Uncharacterized protein n=1 Tax=Ciona intestinalis TaxID=7719 RepID=H2XZE2_CIOIN